MAIRRRRRTSCRAAKETLVATTRDGVGPGVKIELTRLVRNSAIVGCLTAMLPQPVEVVDLRLNDCNGAGHNIELFQATVVGSDVYVGLLQNVSSALVFDLGNEIERAARFMNR